MNAFQKMIVPALLLILFTSCGEDAFENINQTQEVNKLENRQKRPWDSPTIFGPECLPLNGTSAIYCVGVENDIVEWNIPAELEYEVLPFEDYLSNCIEITNINATYAVTSISATVDRDGNVFNLTRYLVTGPPDFNITFNAPICTGVHEIFKIQATPPGQELKVLNWKVQNGPLEIMNQSSTQTRMEVQNEGTATICAEVENQCGMISEKCIVVTIGGPQCEDGDGDTDDDGELDPLDEV